MSVGLRSPLTFAAEAVLSALLESVVVTDADLDEPGPRIVFVNRAFERMTGWLAGEVIGRSPRFMQGALTDRRIFASLRDALQAGEIWSGTTMNYRRDGSPFHLEWSIAPILDPAGCTTHYVAVQRDVSKRVAAREELEAALDQAKAADRAKTEFLAVISDHLKNPLSRILGNIELIEARGAAARARLEEIQRDAHALLEDLEETLDYARAIGGGVDLIRDEIDLAGLLEAAIDRSTPTAARRGIALVMGPVVGLGVLADARCLRQIVFTLVAHAVKGSAAGTRIDLRLEATAEGGALIGATRRGAAADPDEPMLSVLGDAPTPPRIDEVLGLTIAERLAGVFGGSIEHVVEDEEAEWRLRLPEARRLPFLSAAG